MPTPALPSASLATKDSSTSHSPSGPTSRFCSHSSACFTLAPCGRGLTCRIASACELTLERGPCLFASMWRLCAGAWSLEVGIAMEEGALLCSDVGAGG
eukprot:CAMPEP_0114122806 /NCGR_PEP_ID=MMETSP0043_2-20121206/7889_1 /TAXON_ID=464988 /ORGANISM="Hemiselmis andersenii, Strain CCMP644" /LENGTH=98 /DNA_ID=CAMNT_0001215541 /DNA_START=335 /DNA_END=631 /DNA_ORIENTATION=-